MAGGKSPEVSECSLSWLQKMNLHLNFWKLQNTFSLVSHIFHTFYSKTFHTANTGSFPTPLKLAWISCIKTYSQLKVFSVQISSTIIQQSDKHNGITLLVLRMSIQNLVMFESRPTAEVSKHFFGFTAHTHTPGRLQRTTMPTDSYRTANCSTADSTCWARTSQQRPGNTSRAAHTAQMKLTGWDYQTQVIWYST